jgi:hypothetical protein
MRATTNTGILIRLDSQSINGKRTPPLRFYSNCEMRCQQEGRVISRSLDDVCEYY